VKEFLKANIPRSINHNPKEMQNYDVYYSRYKCVSKIDSILLVIIYKFQVSPGPPLTSKYKRKLTILIKFNHYKRN